MSYAARRLTNARSQSLQLCRCANRAGFSWPGFLFSIEAITRDSRLVGTIGSWVSDGVTEVTYWIDRTCWGLGIATQALNLLLADPGPCCQRQRRVARVLQKVGFRPIGTDVSLARGRAAEIEETSFELP